MSFIQYHFEGHVGFITLNRPDKMNSFNQAMALTLQRQLDNCADDENVRTICITGEGRAFCAGQDLAEVTDPNGPELQSIVRNHYNPIINRIRMIKKPVIAAVNGVAAGAGANIALACDIVVAKKSASFIQAFSKIGLIPDSGGTFFLPRIIGFQKALALMMTGEKVSAEEAERIGMIYKYFPDETFNEAYRLLAFNLSNMPTKALVYTKLALNNSSLNTLDQQLALEEEYQHLCGLTEDYEEGITAFLEKRKPIFKGK